VRITSGGIYLHFSRSYLLPVAVFTAALVCITSGGIYRHLAVYTATLVGLRYFQQRYLPPH